MNDDPFYPYRSFFTKPPLLVIEWHDTETEAIGWLAINSLRNGAAGGGTRMRAGATKEECIFLAKTMEIKFNVSGPPIGGAKSVINFNPNDSRKRGVLNRWYQSISPFLRHCYGTGGDLYVDEIKEVMPILSENLGIKHPQEGIVNGHIKCNANGYWKILQQLNEGVKMPLAIENMPDQQFSIADMITGYGLTRALYHFYEIRSESLKGKKVLIEGFGAVGGSAAFYLAEAGAKVVGILSLNSDVPGEFRWQISDDYLEVKDILPGRDKENNLPADSHHGDSAAEFWNRQADIFVPAARSHTINQETIEALLRAGVKVIASGANNPFYINLDNHYKDMGEMVEHALEPQRQADELFTIIPDFIANCGMARVFAYLMEEKAIIDSQKIFEDVDKTIQEAIQKLLRTHSGDKGLLSRSYSIFMV